MCSDRSGAMMQGIIEAVFRFCDRGTHLCDVGKELTDSCPNCRRLVERAHKSIELAIVLIGYSVGQ